jgi:hypothetical protein
MKRRRLVTHTRSNTEPAARGRRAAAWRSQLGQDAVEFAIILPLLLLVFLGVADFSRIMFSAITISNAAREGARYGAFFPNDPAGTEAAVIAEAAGSGLDLGVDTEIIISCPEAPGAPACPRGTPLRVEVTYMFRLITTSLFASVDLPVYSYAEMVVP